ncbi:MULTISPECIES: hypothetical protein [unclassified Mesorhizobium]|uniref:hypothetical protein n=1 Tax=unclassified Mesorhizobium TaxID=325217 RepID=UPI00247B1452|nr:MULTISPECIES: hypothetical protein [unclassified Mesorhizobium]
MQQALLQVLLQEQWDPTFSEHSYGFRPARSAHQAVAQAQCYMPRVTATQLTSTSQDFRPG